MTPDQAVPVADPFLLIADEWPGAWDALDFDRPDDWRQVAGQLAWDVAEVCGAWVFLEAHHQDEARAAGLRERAAIVARVLRDDLPFMVEVGPSTPAGEDQPQLPLVIPDDPGLERLSERDGQLYWRTYFALSLHLRTELALHRAAPALRQVWLRERDVEVDAVSSTEEVMAAIRQQLGETVDPARLQQWISRREREDRELVERVGAQIALQVECLLREQVPTVLPLVEEGLALHLDDAALGAALHVRVDGSGSPIGLCLVSHDGRPRSTVPTFGAPETLLRDLVRVAGASSAT